MSHFPRRSPESPEAMEARVAAARTTPGVTSPAPTGETGLLLLRRLALEAAPISKRKVTVEFEEDGLAVGVFRYEVKLYGPELLRPIVQAGPTAEQAAYGLKKAYAIGRREKDIDTLTRELGRLRGEALTESEAAGVRQNLLACRSMGDYDALAAKYRAHAVKQANTYNQAA